MIFSLGFFCIPLPKDGLYISKNIFQSGRTSCIYKEKTKLFSYIYSRYIYLLACYIYMNFFWRREKTFGRAKSAYRFWLNSPPPFSLLPSWYIKASLVLFLRGIRHAWDALAKQSRPVLENAIGKIQIYFVLLLLLYKIIRRRTFIYCNTVYNIQKRWQKVAGRWRHLFSYSVSRTPLSSIRTYIVAECMKTGAMSIMPIHVSRDGFIMSYPHKDIRMQTTVGVAVDVARETVYIVCVYTHRLLTSNSNGADLCVPGLFLYSPFALLFFSFGYVMFPCESEFLIPCEYYVPGKDSFAKVVKQLPRGFFFIAQQLFCFSF